MIPFCKVENHAQECRECDWPPIEYPVDGEEEDGVIVGSFFFDDDEDCINTTDTIQFEGKLFFFRAFMTNGIFTVDVVMKGSLEECEEFRIEAAVLDPNSGDDFDDKKASFQPRPLKEDNKPGFCLTVPFNSMSEIGALDEEEDDDDDVDIYKVEVGIEVIKA